MQHYRTSGRINPRFLLLLPLAVGLAVGAVWAYQWGSGLGTRLAPANLSGTTYVGICVLLLLAHLGAVVLLLAGSARLATLTVRLGRCRNRVVAVLFGLLLGLLMLTGRHAFGFVAWKAELRAAQSAGAAKAANSRGAPSPKNSKTTLVDFGKACLERGVLPHRVDPDSERTVALIPGWTVLLLYAFELLLLVFPAAGAIRAVNEAYDEKAGRWLRRERLLAIPTSAEEASRIAAAESADILLQLAVPAAASPRYSIVYDLYRAVNPASPSYLCVAMAEWRNDTGDGFKPAVALAMRDLVLLTPEQLAALETDIRQLAG